MPFNNPSELEYLFIFITPVFTLGGCKAQTVIILLTWVGDTLYKVY